MISLNHKVWGRFSRSRWCARTRAGTGPCVVCAHVNEGVLCCKRARGLLHPGGRTGPKLHPRPISQSLLPHPNAVMGCLRGWWFPWQPAAFCAPRVMRAVCWRLRGEERRETGGYRVILGGGEVNNFQPLFRARLFSVSPSLSLINTGPWLKRQHEPNEAPICIYMLCKIRTDAGAPIHLDVVVLDVSNSHV